MMCACFTAMCEFIGYETKDKNIMKNKIAEDWEAEPELEKAQEEQQQQQQPVPVTQ
jgi:hypothetical protein